LPIESWSSWAHHGVPPLILHWVTILITVLVVVVVHRSGNNDKNLASFESIEFKNKISTFDEVVDDHPTAVAYLFLAICLAP